MNFCYFGYGSLVNAQTRCQEGVTQLVTLKGWVRQWKQCIETPFGQVCSLTIAPKPGSDIDGVLVCEPLDKLAALDAREIGYSRYALTPQDFSCEKPDSLPDSTYVYQSLPACYRPACNDYPILQSYVDCVVQGFIACYGIAGAQRFIHSTEGWDGPILNDRHAPHYPRAVTLTIEQLALIDDLLKDQKPQN